MTIDVDSSDFDDKKRGDEGDGSTGRYLFGGQEGLNVDRSKKGRRIDQGSSQNVTELPVLNIGKIQESLLEDEQMVSRIDRRWGSWEVSG